MNDQLDTNDNPLLLNSIIDLIDRTRHLVAKTVNQELTLLYWNIGKTINDGILKKDRADYGKKKKSNVKSCTFKAIWSRFQQKKSTKFY